MLADRFPGFLDRIRGERIDPAVTGRVGALRRADERGRVVELGHQPVEPRRCRRAGHQWPSDSRTFASGAIVRISKIEIIGRKRMNRKNSVTNMPIVPMNVIQSQIVG